MNKKINLSVIFKNTGTPWLAILVFFPAVWLGVTLGDQVYLFIFHGTDSEIYIEDSKHGILSNGQEITGFPEFIRISICIIFYIAIMILLTWGLDISFGFFRKRVKRMITIRR